MEQTSVTEHPLGTRAIVQVGMIVRDIERTAKAFADVFGVEIPPIQVTDPVATAHTVYNGAPTPGQAKLAFFQLGDMSLELIEPFGGPSTWQEFLDAHGEGIHHIAFSVKDMAKAKSYLAGKGLPMVQQGDFTGGSYAYIDSAPALGMILELLTFGQ